MAIEVVINNKVAWLTINRPERRNALDDSHINQMTDIFRNMKSMSEVSCLVIDGSEGAFCAGQDLKQRDAEIGSVNTEYHLTDFHNRMLNSLASIPQPTIARIEGACAGGGVGLAMTCDIRLMVDGSFILLPFVNLSLGLDSGLSYLLPQMVRYDNALLTSIEGRRIGGDEAKELGMVTEVGSKIDIDDRLGSLTKSISSHEPEVIRRIKRQLKHGSIFGFAESLAAEAAEQGDAGRSPEHRRALARFIQSSEQTTVK